MARHHVFQCSDGSYVAGKSWRARRNSNLAEAEVFHSAAAASNVGRRIDPSGKALPVALSIIVKGK